MHSDLKFVSNLTFVLFVASILLGCSGGGGGSGCDRISKNDFGCADPDACVAVILTWNYRGAGKKGSANLDLDLDLTSDGPLPICTYSGDVGGGAGQDPVRESYVCQIALEAEYEFSWSTLFIFDIDTRIDVNDRGDVSCRFDDKRGDLTIEVP